MASSCHQTLRPPCNQAAAFNRRMRKTARTVVWEGAEAQSSAPDPIAKRVPTEIPRARTTNSLARAKEPSDAGLKNEPAMNPHFGHRISALLRLSCLLVLISGPGGAVAAQPRSDLLSWPAITRQTRPWAYWWWMGSAVDPTNLNRELQRYHDAGLGGVHIIPIYGAKGYEDKFIPYLSPKWMEMLRSTVTEAHRLDLGVDMTTGTGWCFGGPHVTDAEANASVIVKSFDVPAGGKISTNIVRQQTQALVAFSAEGKSVE